jgi:hypothetical protein
MSMPTSGTKVSYCSGHDPEWWANELNYPQWPGSILPEDTTLTDGANVTKKTATKFSQCFSCTGLMATLAGKTYLEVLKSTGAPSHFAAALLNVSKGWVPVLTENSLKTMWYEYSTSGRYTPTGGTVWYEVDIIQYFQSTTV